MKTIAGMDLGLFKSVVKSLMDAESESEANDIISDSLDVLDELCYLLKEMGDLLDRPTKESVVLNRAMMKIITKYKKDKLEDRGLGETE